MGLPRLHIARAVALASVTILALGACAQGQGGGSSTGAAGSGSTAKTAEFCADQTADPSGVGELTPDPEISADLTFWGWYNIVPKAVLDDFNKIYPNINVKFVDFSTADTHTKLTTALVGGAGAPDISMIQDRDAPRFWDLPLYDLTDCVEPYLTTFPDFKQAKVERPNGQVQAVPWEADAGIVVYRKDLFQKYGVDPASIETWDDYVEAGKTIVAASGGSTKMVMSLPQANDNGMAGHITSDFNMMLNQQGGAYFSDDGEVTVNGGEGVRALELVKRFRDDGITLDNVASGQAEVEAFQTDKVATILQQASVSFGLKSNLEAMAGKWGVIKLPAFEPGGNRGAIRGGTSLAITTQSKNPEAAWKFLEFWLLRTDSRWVNYETGGLVENIFQPAAQDERFLAGDPYFGGDKFLQVVAESAQEAPVFAENLKTNQLESAFKQRLRAYLDGGTDAQATLDLVAEDTRKAQ